MKRLIAGLALALCAVLTHAATTVPVQLLAPAGSTAGQAIVSTGPSSAPSWASVNAAALNGATFAAPGAIGGTTPGAGTFTTLRGNSLVKVIATSPTSQSVPVATVTTVTNWTKLQDAGGNLNATTGIFTAPRAGNYLVQAQMALNSVNWAVGSTASTIIQRNGATVTQGFWLAQSAASFAPLIPEISTVVNCAANDTISVAVYQNGGSASSTISAINYFFNVIELP